MFKSIKLLVFLLLFSACSGNFEKNRADLDSRLGECDNPVRPMSKYKYKECKAREMANGEAMFDLENGFNGILGNKNSNNYSVQYSVNPYLWNAALKTTSSYSLKIADNQGGLIETDWIYNADSDQERCLIKIRILSQELISNGVETNFVCEEKNNDKWVVKKEYYIEEAKQINLQILNLAAELSNTTL